jgi:tetratricopeptide (TPR) repeat protein
LFLFSNLRLLSFYPYRSTIDEKIGLGASGMMQSASSIIGRRYQIQEKLGEGAMGSVYRAVDRLNKQTVALKRVVTSLTSSSQPSIGDSPITATRVIMANEFQTLASLHHPHIIQVLDYGFDEARQPYFTMNLLEGAQPLTKAGQGQPDRVKLRLLTEMLQALAYLHQHGIIHRDLKPDNALVTADGEVKVLDFGLAALRETLEVGDGLYGTIAYMAPESFQGEPASTASDLYAVGVMAYEMFAGHHPFNLNNVGQLLNDILNSPINLDALDVDTSLRDIIGYLLQKSPKDRYSDAYEVMTAFSALSTSPIPRETTAIRESFLQSARFVGRQNEISQLRYALREALGQQGSAWLIAGESGVGKSRLLDELRVQGLVLGALVLNGQGVQGGGLSYQLWRDPLRRLALTTDLSDTEVAILDEVVPDMDELLERAVPPAGELKGQAGQERLHTTIINIFRRQEQPILLILEDLHWAVESLEVLEPLIPLTADLPLMIVGSYRNDEKPDLPEQLPGTKMIRLERFGDDSIAELSTSMLGNAGSQPEIVTLLKKETEGNAFFLVEVVRALAETAGSLNAIAYMTLPAQVFAGGVQQVVENRLRRMPADARPLLNFAAVAGRQIDLDLLRAANNDGDLDSWLTICSNASVIDLMNEQWRFAHDKFREGIVNGLSEDDRQQLHREVALAVQKVYADELDDYASIIADHYEAAGDIALTLEWAARAGRHSEATYAPVTSIAFYQKALNIWKKHPDLTISSGKTPLDVHERMGELLNWQARYAEAIGSFEAMRSAAEASQNVKAEAVAWCGLARTQTLQGDVRKALESATRAEELSRSVDAPATLGNALWMKGWVLFRLGNLDEARELAQQVAEIAENLDSQDLIAINLNLLGSINVASGHYDEAASAFEKAHSLFSKLGDRRRAMTITNNLGWLADTRGNYQLAKTLFQEALTIAREIGHRDGEMFYLSNLGTMRVMLGDYPGAEADLRQVIQMSGDAGLSVLSESYRFLAEACLRQGKIDDALRCAQRALVLGHEAASQDYIAAAWRALGLIAGALDEPVKVAADQPETHDAQSCFTESLRICDEHGLDGEKARTLRTWAEYELAYGDAAKGSAMWQEAREIFARLGAVLEAERMAQVPHGKD